MTTARPGPGWARRWHALAVWLVPFVAAMLLTACSNDGEDEARKVLSSFLDSWQNGTIPGHEEEYRELTSGMKNRVPDLLLDELDVDGDRATAVVTVTWPLASEVSWEYETAVELVRADDTWRVDWSPAVVQPELRDGDRLVVRRGEDVRGSILDANGDPITKPRPVVVVGVQPSKVVSAQELADALGAVLEPDGVDTTGLPSRISEADPDAFVEVVTLRKERYLEVRPQIHDLPGTVFREETRVLAPTRSFARSLLGTVGPVTKEDLEAEPGKFEVGDQKGHGGLQERYDELLRGSPEIVVAIERAEGDRELFRAEARPGAAVHTTLDPTVQNAADAAVADAEHNSAVVAIRISDGAVLAVANSPSAGAQNLAMNAQVPPGSTFKIVSGLSLLDRGAVGLDTPVSCPATTNVGGRVFKNAWDGGIENGTFRDAFAQSCNTAFALLAPKLGVDGLAKTAASLGIGVEWDLGAGVYTGSVASDADPVEQAAAAFGQGKTMVSPMAMAAATAGVARGQWQQPSLVTEPAPEAPAGDGPKLNEESVRALHTAMRAVVTDGSGRQLSSVRGDPVYGKTGTAEYGTETPPRSHSWFTGWRGDVAFAVFVEDGGNDVSLAIDVTERFLNGFQ